MTARDLWCWGCWSRKRQREVYPDVWRCIHCGAERDLTDPDELKGITND